MKFDCLVARPQRVLIVRLSSIGDVVLTTPIAAAIKSAMPEVEVDWVVEERSLEVVKMCDGLARVFLFPTLSNPKDIWRRPGDLKRYINELAEIGEQMRARHYDVALDAHGLVKSGLAARLSGAREVIGWHPAGTRECSWLFADHWLKMPRESHAAEASLMLAASLGCPITNPRFPLRVPEDASNKARELLKPIMSGSPVIAVNAGSSKANKCWPVENFAEVAMRAVADFGAKVFLTWGSVGERESAERILSLMNGQGFIAPRVDLFTLAGLYLQADLYLGADTGPTHLAAALGIPVVAVYGTTNPALVGPYGNGHRVVSTYSGPKHQVKARGPNLAGMADIAPSDVYPLLAEALAEQH